jgi:hypothetical protein
MAAQVRAQEHFRNRRLQLVALLTRKPRHTGRRRNATQAAGLEIGITFAEGQMLRGVTFAAENK